jgi:sugar phosphate isomerase/epimerase
MIHPGLVSITFRKLDPTEIIRLVVQAGLKGIEWGGDIHVPHGNLDAARQVGEQTREAGLCVAAYGSYYRAGHGEPVPFETILETARALEAPVIRVWAGNVGSDKADDTYRRQVADDLRCAAAMAQEVGIRVACEFHAQTLTDTPGSAQALFESVNHPALGSYWQPPVGLSREDCLGGLRTVAPWLSHLHVFTWDRGTAQRLKLSQGNADWRAYLDAAGKIDGDRYAMLEFVREDDPEQFLADAATLREYLALPGI